MTSTASLNATPFPFPQLYSFPPFFTLQPHEPSRVKQVAAWLDLIRAYCAHHKLYRLDMDSAASLDLFKNAAIGRTVPRDMLALLFREAVKAGLAEWSTPKDTTRVLVLWKSVAEWAAAMVEWARNAGFTDTVMTGYELRFGDYVTDADFYGMDEVLFCRVIQHLAKQKRVVMVNESKVADELGFKFLPS
ncbi:hypothetical protein H9P43_002269 [Blastocladiella emersonii ATCC 22665]|nr:hypothetical protein H9P43_002269 [Blastocladiella emersonii ATCC 22665]